MKKFTFIAFIFFTFSGVAQKYTRELTGGIIINTRSNFIAGFTGRYSKLIKKDLYQGYGLEIVNIKHPKEIKVPTASASASTFIFAKNNYLFSIRPNYNLEKVLFEKDPNEGIRVSILTGIGPSIAILKPYIIAYQDPKTGKINNQQYDPNVHKDFSYVQGDGGIFEQFGKSKYIIGAHLKTSLIFEYGTIKNRISSIETGFMYEQLTQKAELNPFVSSESAFFTAFINISLGKKYK